MIPFFPVFSTGAFLSFTFCCSGSQLCVVAFLIKPLSYSGSLDMNLYFLGIHTNLRARVYIKKIQVNRGIFHGIPLESVA